MHNHRVQDVRLALEPSAVMLLGLLERRERLVSRSLAVRSPFAPS
jgi:hypothetical protein